MGMGSSSRYSRVRCMAAQSMVVSVGPYMLTTCSPGTAAFHKFTYRACSASPPSAAFFRCVGAYFVSAPEAATQMERRGRPVDGGDARLLHGLEQEHGEGEIFLLKDAAARAERERLVHILAGKIKIKRGLIAEDLVFGIAAEFRHPGREVQDRAVRDDDALRRGRSSRR